jgi:flagellar biosynthesis protein FlhF
MNTPIRIKTFRSKTLQEAFQQIREEFGSDASILETRAARFGIFGRSRIEVTASSNTVDLRLDDSQGNEKDLADPSQNSQSTFSEGTPVDFADPFDPKMEIANSDPERHVDSEEPSMECLRSDRVLEQIHQELIDAGIDPGIASQWVEATRFSKNPKMMQDVWTVRSELLGWIRDMVHAAPPINLEDARQQVLAFVGPPGSGKTTSLAKIAANLSIERELPVGILSTDCLRLGSNHLLQNYAEVLGWHFDVADSIEQIPSCLEGFAGCRFVFLDTSGCSPTDTESLDKLSQLMKLTKPAETHLVLSSTCNVRSFLRYEQAFGRLNPNRMLLTRLDESGGLGAMFPCIQGSSLPISYLTNGQQIPADLIQATETRLAQHIMALSD